MSAELDADSIELPVGWRWAELGELAEFINGDRGKNYPSATDRVSIGVPFINTGHITPNGRLTEKGMDFISWEKFDQLGSGKVRPGDIVYCLRGSTIGKIARNHFQKGAIASSLVIVRSSAPELQEYIFQFLASPTGQRLAQKFDNGSAQPNLSARALSGYRIPLPPIEELKSIATTLGALDDKIELNRKMNATLETMARALFRDWFVDFGPTHAKMEGREPYLAPDLWALFPDRLDGEGKPEGWEIRRVDQLLELAYGKALKATDRLPGDVPVYGSGGITGSHAEALVEGPAVIVGRKGTVGSLYWEDRPCFPIDTVFYVRPLVPLTFCFYALEQMGLDHMNTDAAVPGLNRNNVYRLKVAWPGDDLVCPFDTVASVLRSRIKHNTAESRTLAQTRDFLLPRLMSGELRASQIEKSG